MVLHPLRGANHRMRVMKKLLNLQPRLVPAYYVAERKLSRQMGGDKEQITTLRLPRVTQRPTAHATTLRGPRLR